MVCRFGDYKWVQSGTLDNRELGRTTGTIQLASLGEVVLSLSGDMQGELRGQALTFTNPEYDPKHQFDHGPYKSTAKEYFDGFSKRQTGEVGDILIKPYLYIEWYSNENWRCVIELDREHCNVGNNAGGGVHVE